MPKIEPCVHGRPNMLLVKVPKGAAELSHCETIFVVITGSLAQLKTLN